MISLKYIGTRSGKSLVLQLRSTTIVVNVFEGFQRYCIEKNVSLANISAFVLPSDESVPPFIGTFLTIRDTNRTELNILCTKDVKDKISLARKFTDPLQLRLCYDIMNHNSTLGEHVFSTASISTDLHFEYYLDCNNTVYCFKPSCTRGRFNVTAIPPALPKKFYKLLCNKQNVNFEGKTYNYSDYLEEDKEYEKIIVIYKLHDAEVLDHIIDQNSVFVCFNDEDAKMLGSKLASHNFEQGLNLCRAPCINKLKEYEKIYVLNDNHFIEFKKQYDMQRTLNGMSGSYLLPYANESRKPVLAHSYTLLNSGDRLERNANSGYQIVKDINIEPYGTKFSNKTPSLIFLGTGCAIPSKYRNVSAILYENNMQAILLDCGEDTLGQIRRLGLLQVLHKLTAIFITHSHADHNLGIIAVLRACTQKIRIVGPRCIKEFLDGMEVEVEFYATDSAKVLEQRFYEASRQLFSDHMNCGVRDSTCKLEQDEKQPVNRDDSSTVTSKPCSHLPEDSLAGENMFASAIHNASLSLVCNEESTLGITVPNLHSMCINHLLDSYVLKFDFGFSLKICGVPHCKDSCAILLVDGARRISYSGDTTPSQLFALLSHKCNVMIHEATFSDEDKSRASRVKHTAYSDAMLLGSLARVDKLILSHFSQRYSNKNPKLGAVDFYRYSFEKEEGMEEVEKFYEELE